MRLLFQPLTPLSVSVSGLSPLTFALHVTRSDLELVCRSYLRTTEHDAKSVPTLVSEAKSLLKRAAKKASKDPEAALEHYEDAAYRFLAAATSPLQDQAGQAVLREALGQVRAVNDDVQKLGVRAKSGHLQLCVLVQVSRVMSAFLSAGFATREGSACPRRGRNTAAAPEAVAAAAEAWRHLEAAWRRVE